MEPFNREMQMTSDIRRLVRPGTVVSRCGSVYGHNQVLPSCVLHHATGSPREGGAFAGFEPCEGKLSRTVLRGGASGQPPAPTRSISTAWVDEGRMPEKASSCARSHCQSIHGRRVCPCLQHLLLGRPDNSTRRLNSPFGDRFKELLLDYGQSASRVPPR
jgi:hypothetical protein